MMFAVVAVFISVLVVMFVCRRVWCSCHVYCRRDVCCHDVVDIFARQLTEARRRLCPDPVMLCRVIAKKKVERICNIKQ